MAAFCLPPLPPNPTPAQQREQERARWNHYLLDATWRSTRFNSQPNALLQEAVLGVPPGVALDVNMGEGRNALYLAGLGWQVTGIDLADQALAFAQQRAIQLGVALTTVVGDANTYDWGTSSQDLILLCYADESAHLERVQAALRPGGLLVLENFHADVNQTWQMPPDHRVGFASNELPDLYRTAGFQIVRYEEPVAVADFTRETHRLVRLVARKNNKA
ncbi:class I SAM-dependent methyltransferase [Hymenobacter guriensis]|uniref:Methyltransferase domain-containing protein n=1 Tax=Hymenobacter guriensis TaxID=2793065 RepID=A0ABS0L9N2_9BACT|nr:class I SAM-dependent methyltransferase [Hymenobacter guriensis]MBG8556423.1 methyltransferase domain-containing protein [Hymenobacter guriensis]